MDEHRVLLTQLIRACMDEIDKNRTVSVQHEPLKTIIPIYCDLLRTRKALDLGKVEEDGAGEE